MEEEAHDIRGRTFLVHRQLRKSKRRQRIVWEIAGAEPVGQLKGGTGVEGKGGRTKGHLVGVNRGEN